MGSLGKSRTILEVKMVRDKLGMTCGSVLALFGFDVHVVIGSVKSRVGDEFACHVCKRVSTGTRF
jgi:hypothetical protein